MQKLFAFLLVFFANLHLFGQIHTEGLHFHQFSTPQSLPNGRVHRIMKDSDGFVWIATYYGLFRYDGYDVLPIKSSINKPGVLLHNNVLCLEEDHSNHIWIGTQGGLNMLDKSTGAIRSYKLSNVPRQRVHDIYTDSQGTTYIGYIRGVYYYNAEADTILMMEGPAYKGELPVNANIQHIIEDQQGNLIISTWTQGLYRYLKNEKQFIHYELNDDDGNPVKMQQLMMDCHGQIWLGTYGYGLYKLEFSTDQQSLDYVVYKSNPHDLKSLNTDFVLSLAENELNHSLWLGTRQGISIMEFADDGTATFTNFTDKDQQHYFAEHEVNDLLCDDDNMMWLATDNGGIFYTSSYGSKFSTFHFRDNGLFLSDAVTGLYVSDDGAIWANLGNSVAYHKDNTDKLVLSGPVPHGIYHSVKQNLVLIALRDVGLSICRDGQEIHRYLMDNCEFLPSNNVRCVHEDEEGNWWIGTYAGLGVRYDDGRSFKYVNDRDLDPLLGLEIIHIATDRRGSLWLSTSDSGIIRLSGNLNNPQKWTIEQYNSSNGKLPSNTSIFVNCDQLGHIWAGLEGSGLCLFNEETNSFESVHMRYNLPGDMVNSMKQDADGNYWIGTNQGLACLTLDGVNLRRMRKFTQSDGLPDNFFSAKSACFVKGTMYFGCSQGLVYFRPSESNMSQRKVKLCVTDILINGTSLKELSPEDRKEVSPESSLMTKKLSLPSRFNNFEICFASLTYNMPQQNRYAYRLKNFDSGWTFVSSNNRSAYYTNLGVGNYTFEVMGTNENGDWSEVRQISIVVLPPWWRSLWAYVIYFILLIGVVYVVQSQLRKRLKWKNALRVKQMEAAKIEELNHVKLQFFANITHELMTPLTIISASLDQLKSEPTHELLGTMSVNVQRLMRLLQQILEFRKAETGNLKLRVSKGDLALFVRHEVESFIPLVRKRQQHISVACQEEVMQGYFDTDKLDKILYNLLSNSAKYTDIGGVILVDLKYLENRDRVCLIVKDTGRGMSEQQQRNLFKRFYEGDYRQSHTIGTGIGLSLVRDLVELHKGSIRVESQVGVGTTIFVELPITENSFDAEQIIQVDSTPQTDPIQQITDMPNPGLDDSSVDTTNDENRRTILIVEDNEELQKVMSQLLNRSYHVLTADNGRKALELMHNEDIDLVISDVVMPEMDGIEMTKVAKSDIDVCHIPIILLTAKRAEEDRDAGYEAGADAYLTKPFSLSVLQTRIQNLLRRRERNAEDFKHQIAIDTSALSISDIDQDFLEKAIDVVNKHLSDSDFDVEQFSDKMSTNRSTLYKKLRQLTNLNPSGFIRNIRLKAACKVMEENPNVRINELAYSVGFNDPKYFSICFKKEFGMQPSEYCNCFKIPSQLV